MTRHHVSPTQLVTRQPQHSLHVASRVHGLYHVVEYDKMRPEYKKREGKDRLKAFVMTSGDSTKCVPTTLLWLKTGQIQYSWSYVNICKKNYNYITSSLIQLKWWFKVVQPPQNEIAWAPHPGEQQLSITKIELIFQCCKVVSAIIWSSTAKFHSNNVFSINEAGLNQSHELITGYTDVYLSGYKWDSAAKHHTYKHHYWNCSSTVHLTSSMVMRENTALICSPVANKVCRGRDAAAGDQYRRYARRRFSTSFQFLPFPLALTGQTHAHHRWSHQDHTGLSISHLCVPCEGVEWGCAAGNLTPPRRAVSWCPLIRVKWWSALAPSYAAAP